MINCALSMLPIPPGAEVAVLLMQNPFHPEQWEVRAPPLQGKWTGSDLKSYRAKDRETIRLWVEGLDLDRMPERLSPSPDSYYQGAEPKGTSPSTRRLFDLLFRGEIRVHRLGDLVKEQILAVSIAIVHREIWDQMLTLEPEEYLGEVMPLAERTKILRRLLRGSTPEQARAALEAAGIVHMPRPDMNGLTDHLLRMPKRARPPRAAGARGTTIRAAAEVIHLTQLMRGLCRSWTPSIWNGPGDRINRATLTKYQKIVTTFSRGASTCAACAESAARA